MASIHRILAGLTSTEIKSRLDGSSGEPGRIELGFNPDPRLLRDAAVLVPLVRENDCWSVLLTARTDLVEDHKGQVAFPGGAVEPGDITPEAAAIREAGEEIGLPNGSAEILGRLSEYQTISNYLVTPVVAVVAWPFPLKLQTHEVRRAFTIPLGFLAQPANHSERLTEIRGQVVPLIYFKPWQGETLWGISARIMLDFLVRLDLH